MTSKDGDKIVSMKVETKTRLGGGDHSNGRDLIEQASSST